MEEIIFELNNPPVSTVEKCCLRHFPDPFEVQQVEDIIACLQDIVVPVPLPMLTPPTTPPINKSSACGLDIGTVDTEMGSDAFEDDSLVEVYYRVPTTLNPPSGKEISSLDRDDKFMNLHFDIDTITHSQLNAVKVDINFNVKKTQVRQNCGQTLETPIHHQRKLAFRIVINIKSIRGSLFCVVYRCVHKHFILYSKTILLTLMENI